MSANTSNTFLMQCYSQRSQRQGFILSQNKGNNRFSMQCPSSAFTPRQLDMRRKSEILQYKKNAVNASSNNKRWAWLATQKKGTVYCEDITQKEQPSSSSDVPGPVIMLYRDTSVPLSNYRNDQYIKFNDVPYPGYKFDWEVTPYNDLSIPNLTKSSIATLSFGEASASNYSFQTTIPISITIGANIYNPIYDDQISHIDLQVNEATLYVYYNDTILTSESINISHLDNLTISFENSQDGGFSASKFVGSLDISSIILSVFPFYFLTMQLVVNNSYTEYNENGDAISSSANNNIYNTQIGNIVNITGTNDPYYNSSNNCTIESPPLNNFQSFSVTNNFA